MELCVAGWGNPPADIETEFRNTAKNGGQAVFLLLKCNLLWSPPQIHLQIRSSANSYLVASSNVIQQTTASGRVKANTYFLQDT